MIKKIQKLLLSMVIMPLSVSFAGAPVVPNPAAPQIAAKSYILVDFDSGIPLAEGNADERLPPASITKLMTSYVLFNELASGNVRLDDEVLISERAWRMVGSRSFIEVNTRVPVEALLRGMIVQSGNDAAVALAEHVAGSEEVFAQVMNQYAQKLGMYNTNYTNATGLPDPDLYTTSRDIATLAVAMIRDFPEYYRWYSEKEYTYNNITQHNRNRLLWRDETVDGLKTGHTEAAGYCLAASAKRGDMRLISVVLGTRSENVRAQETSKLLNYGFRFFESHQLYPAGHVVTQSRVWKGSDKQLEVGVQQALHVLVPRGRYEHLAATVHLTSPIIAPVTAGTALGEVEIRLNNDVIATQTLVAMQDIPTGSMWRRFVDAILMLIWG